MNWANEDHYHQKKTIIKSTVHSKWKFCYLLTIFNAQQKKERKSYRFVTRVNDDRIFIFGLAFFAMFS